jgi:hypothetical protein
MGRAPPARKRPSTRRIQMTRQRPIDVLNCRRWRVRSNISAGLRSPIVYESGLLAPAM